MHKNRYAMEPEPAHGLAHGKARNIGHDARSAAQFVSVGKKNKFATLAKRSARLHRLADNPASTALNRKPYTPFVAKLHRFIKRQSAEIRRHGRD
jgi:hypothetical protein